MITKILNGTFVLKRETNSLRKKVDKYSQLFFSHPCISIILIDNIFSSNLYVKNKIFLCKNINIRFLLFKISKTIKNKTLKMLINIINSDNDVNGILIQKPIPMRLNTLSLFKIISFSKDVDLMNPYNFLKYITGFSSIISPCISKSVFLLLKELHFKFSSAKVAMFGFSDLIGKPLCYELLSKGCKVYIIDKHDNKSSILSKSCDIIIIAIGSPLFLSKQFISHGSIVIDIGINKSIDGSAVGDADFNNLIGKASWITPVPGGIGPINVFFLLSNLVDLSFYQKYKLIK